MTGAIEAPSRTGGWAALTAATLLLVFLAGCATSAQTGGDPDVERYPAALIAAAEPVAPAVGFVLARVRWRGGYLRGRDDVLEHLARQLRPLDIMLLTNEGRLSGRSGSGLFSHAAVYVGNEQQLRRNGLWNQASVVPHQESLRNGQTIIESEQHHGTSLSTLLQASDSDRIVILRPRDRGAAWRRQATSSLLARVGTAFDHRFRLDDKVAIFCTQLVDMAMPELNLPRRTAYGREIILPDDIATTAMQGNCLSVVSYVRADENGWEALGARELSADIREAWSGTGSVSAFAEARPTSHAYLRPYVARAPRLGELQPSANARVDIARFGSVADAVILASLTDQLDYVGTISSAP